MTGLNKLYNAFSETGTTITFDEFAEGMKDEGFQNFVDTEVEGLKKKDNSQPTNQLTNLPQDFSVPMGSETDLPLLEKQKEDSILGIKEVPTSTELASQPMGSLSVENQSNSGFILGKTEGDSAKGLPKVINPIDNAPNSIKSITPIIPAIPEAVTEVKPITKKDTALKELDLTEQDVKESVTKPGKYISTQTDDAIFQIPKDRLEIAGEDAEGNVFFNTKDGKFQMVYKDGVLQSPERESIVNADGTSTELPPKVYGKDFFVTKEGYIRFADEMPENKTTTDYKLTIPPFDEFIEDTLSKDPVLANDAVLAKYKEGKIDIKKDINGNLITNDEGEYVWKYTDKELYDQEVERIKAHNAGNGFYDNEVDQNRSDYAKNNRVYNELLQGAQVETEVKNESIRLLGDEIAKKYNYAPSQDEIDAELLQLRANQIAALGNYTPEQAAQIASQEKEAAMQSDRKVSSDIAFQFLQQAEKVSRGEDRSTNKKFEDDLKLTDSEKAVWQSLASDPEFGKWYNTYGVKLFGDAETGLITNASTTTLRKRVVDTYMNFRQSELSDRIAVIDRARGNQKKMDVTKAFDTGDLNKIESARSERTPVLQAQQGIASKFKELGVRNGEYNKGFDILYARDKKAAEEFAGYKNNEAGYKATVTAKNIANGFVNVAADIVGGGIALSTLFSEKAKNYLSAYDYSTKNPFDVLNEGMTDKFKEYSKDGSTVKVYNGKVFTVEKDGSLKYNEVLTNSQSALNDWKFVKEDSEVNMAGVARTFSNQIPMMAFPELMAGRLAAVKSGRLLKNMVNVANLAGKESLIGKNILAFARSPKDTYSALLWGEQVMKSNVIAGQEAGLNKEQAFLYGALQSVATMSLLKISPDAKFFGEYKAINRDVFKLISQGKYDVAKRTFLEGMKKIGKSNFGEMGQEEIERNAQNLINQTFNTVLGDNKDGSKKFSTGSYEEFTQTWQETGVITTGLELFNAVSGRGRLKLKGNSNLQNHILASLIPEFESQYLDSVEQSSWTGVTSKGVSETRAKLKKIREYTDQIPPNTQLHLSETEQYVISMQTIEDLKNKKNTSSDVLSDQYDAKIAEEKAKIDDLFEIANERKNSKTNEDPTPTDKAPETAQDENPTAETTPATDKPIQPEDNGGASAEVNSDTQPDITFNGIEFTAIVGDKLLTGNSEMEVQSKIDEINAASTPSTKTNINTIENESETSKQEESRNDGTPQSSEGINDQADDTVGQTEQDQDTQNQTAEEVTDEDLAEIDAEIESLKQLQNEGRKQTETPDVDGNTEPTNSGIQESEQGQNENNQQEVPNATNDRTGEGNNEVNPNEYNFNNRNYTRQADGNFTSFDKNGKERKVTSKNIINSLNELHDKANIVNQNEKDGYVLKTYKDGRAVITTPKGTEISSVITRQRDANRRERKQGVRGKVDSKIRNPNFSNIMEQVFGEESEFTIDKDRKKRLKEALQFFIPTNVREIAMLYFAEGGKVSATSIGSEILGNSKDGNNERGKDKSTAEFSWAYFGKIKQNESFETLAEKLMEDYSDLGIDASDLRSALIDVVGSYSGVVAIQEEMLNLYNQYADPYFGMTEEDAYQMWKADLSPAELSIIDSVEAEQNMNDAEKQTYFAEQFNNSINSLTNEQQDEIYNPTKSRGNEGIQPESKNTARSNPEKESAERSREKTENVNSPEYKSLLSNRDDAEKEVANKKSKLDLVSKKTNKDFQGDQEDLFGERPEQQGMFDERADGNAGKEIIATAKSEYDQARAELSRLNNAIRDFESGKVKGTEELDFQSTDKQFTPITQKAYNALVKKLSGVFKKFGGKLLTDKTAFKNKLQQEGSAEDITNKNGEVYGAKFPDGTIYLNPDKVNANTPIHEFSHLWEQLMPTRFKQGVEILKSTPIGKKTFAELKDNAGYEGRSDEQIWNEALVTVMGNEGERIFNMPKANKLKEWLTDFFKKLGDVLGIKKLTPTDNLSVFVKGALKEVMGEKEIFAEVATNVNNNINFSFLSAEDFDADGNVKPEVLAQIEAERKSIIEKAKADGTYLKAPNGNATNLNEEQWVNVRTERFKNWFGDWDVSEKNSIFDKNKSDHDQRTAVYNQFESILGRSGTQEAEIGKSETSNGRGIESANRVSPKAVRKILVDSAKQTGSYIDDIPSMSRGQYPSGHESEVYQSKDKETVLKVNRLPFLNDFFSFNDWVEKIIAHNQTFPDVAYTIKGVTKNSNGEVSIVLEQPAVNIDLNSSATQQEIDSKLAELGFTEKKDGNSTYWTNGIYNVSDVLPKNVLKDKDGDLYFIDGYVVRTPVNSENISKAVDSNGEPEILYHLGERKDEFFTPSFEGEFDTDFGIFFSDSQEAVKDYGETWVYKNPQTIESHLNLKNPFIIDISSIRAGDKFTEHFDDYQNERFQNENIGWEGEMYRKILQFAKDNGFDGAILRNTLDPTVLQDTHVVFEPNQIKSATGNAGTFSQDTGNINFQIVDEQSNDYNLIAKSNPLPVRDIRNAINIAKTKGFNEALEAIKQYKWYNGLSDKRKELITEDNLVNIIEESQRAIKENYENSKLSKAEALKIERKKSKEKLAEQAKTFAEKIANIKANFNAKLEELRQTNKDAKNRIAARKMISRQAYNKVIEMLSHPAIKNDLSPSSIKALLRKADRLLNARDTVKVLDEFYDMAQRIEERIGRSQKLKLKQSEADFARYNEIRDIIMDEIVKGTNTDEIMKLFPDANDYDLAKRALNDIKSDDISIQKALSLVELAQAESERIVKSKPKEGTTFDKAMKALVDRQYLPKKMLDAINAGTTVDRMINFAGANSRAKHQFDVAYNEIWNGLTNEERKLLDLIILNRRFIAIDDNRQARGIPPIINTAVQIENADGTTLEINLNGKIATKAIEGLRAKHGDAMIDKLISKSDKYFDQFKGLLKEMKNNGLISDIEYDNMAEIDYQPRVFLDKMLDFEGNMKDGKERDDFMKSTGLNAEQIKSLRDGSEASLMMRSEWLLGNAFISRNKAMMINNVNVDFMTRTYPNAKITFEKYQSIDTNKRTKEQKRFIKYFTELQSKIKENPITGFNKNGNPEYKYSSTPQGYKSAYYYINGMQHRFLMEEALYNDWHDTVSKFDPDASWLTKTASAPSRIVKFFATGNNPAFALVNTPRDFWHTYNFSSEYSPFILKGMFDLTKDFLNGIKEIGKYDKGQKDNLMYRAMEYGVGMDFLNTQGAIERGDDMSKVVDSLLDKKIQDKASPIINKYLLLKNISRYSEVMFRVAIFDRSLQNQLKTYNKANKTSYKSVEQLDATTKDDMYNAASRSARSVMDFNQGGRVTKDAEAFIPYINAATQGSRVAIQEFAKDPVTVSGKMLQTATLFASTAIGISAMFIAGFKDDDDDRSVWEIYLHAIDGITKRQRTNGMNIVYGYNKETGEYKYFSFAKAQALTPLMNLVENLATNYMRNEAGMPTKSWKEILTEVGYAFSENVDPSGLTDIVTNPKQDGTLDSAIKSLGKFPAKNPLMKGLMTYLTGYDFFFEQDLLDTNNGTEKILEGSNSDSVELFYKQLGWKAGSSPIRTKALVESIFTSPTTNPHIAIAYAGLNSVTSLFTGVEDKKKYDSEYAVKTLGLNRLLKETTGYARQVNVEEKIDPKLDAIVEEQLNKKMNVDQLANYVKNKKYWTDQEISETFAKIEDITKDPEEQGKIAKKLMNKVKNRTVDSSMWNIKFNAKSDEERAYKILRDIGDAVAKPEIIDQLTQAGIWTENIQRLYVKYYTEREQEKRKK